MENGTYLMKPNGKLAPINSPKGYWVAEREVQLSDVRVGQIVGVWTDDNGKEWVDESHLVEDLPTALALAEAWEQIAIYDCQNGKVIEV